MLHFQSLMWAGVRYLRSRRWSRFRQRRRMATWWPWPGRVAL